VSAELPSEERIGAGALLSGGEFAGEVVRADSVPAVLELLSRELGDSVLVTDQASATAFAPILPRLRGVVCAGGGEAAHLAIVARGLDLPCVMQARLQRQPGEGERIRVGADGSIWLGR
jgi:phosphohistidine swiveling domain-containing protein